MLKHVAATHTHTHTHLFLPTVGCAITNWNAIGMTNLKNTIHSALSSLNLHCLLTSDGQWRIGTKGNSVISVWYKEMQLQLYPIMTGLTTLYQGRQFLLQLLQNIRFTVCSTESCLLLLPTFGYKLNSRHQSAARLIFSNNMQAIRSFPPSQ